MKSFKEYQNNIDTSLENINPDNLPVGHFSIGGRPEIIIKYPINKQLAEWIYDRGYSKSEYETYPSKFSSIVSDNYRQSRDNIHKVEVLNKSLEKYYHPGTSRIAKRLYFHTYTGAGSYFINRLLIARHLDIPYDNEDMDFFSEDKVKQKVKSVDETMEKYKKPAPSSFYVYTGVGAGLNIDKHRSNRSNRMYLPAFTSTSLAPDVAKSFSHNNYNNIKKEYKEVVRLHIPEGSSHGTYLGSAGLGSEKEHEHEFLLDRGHIIQFMGESRFTPSSDGGRILVHDARIIRQVKKPIVV